jgi:hypothetical protein
LFEKRGHKWALTRFGFERWGDSEEVIESEAAVDVEEAAGD